MDFNSINQSINRKSTHSAHLKFKANETNEFSAKFGLKTLNSDAKFKTQDGLLLSACTFPSLRHFKTYLHTDTIIAFYLFFYLIPNKFNTFGSHHF